MSDRGKGLVDSTTTSHGDTPARDTFILLKCRYYPGVMTVRDNYGTWTSLADLQSWIDWCMALAIADSVDSDRFEDHFYYIEVPVNEAGGAIPFKPGTERLLTQAGVTSLYVTDRPFP